MKWAKDRQQGTIKKKKINEKQSSTKDNATSGLGPRNKNEGGDGVKRNEKKQDETTVKEVAACFFLLLTHFWVLLSVVCVVLKILLADPSGFQKATCEDFTSIVPSFLSLSFCSLPFPSLLLVFGKRKE